MKVLLLFAHPAFHKSKVNKMLVEGLDTIPGVTFRDLYQEYPEMDIDVKREQALLEAHDAVIMHFPLFWYSTPAILKEWQDLVLEHGWAFGSKGNALKDKIFFCLLTAGGPRSAYRVGDFHNHTVEQLLSPLRQTAVLCKMKPLPPFVVFGSHDLETDESAAYKHDLLHILEELINDRIDLENVAEHEFLNDYVTLQD
jgi:glutathione-regulated potassium-efflux system ancillary protein KefG